MIKLKRQRTYNNIESCIALCICLFGREPEKYCKITSYHTYFSKTIKVFEKHNHKLKMHPVGVEPTTSGT